MNKSSGNFTPYIIVLFVVIIIVVLFLSLSKSQNMIVVEVNNTTTDPIDMKLNKYQDSDCGMVIDDLTYSSQVITPSMKRYFFHDHGGMVHWLASKPFKEKSKIWVMAKDTGHYIDGRKAWYSRTDNTPMLYGFGAYEKRKDGLIDFKTMSLYMLRGENLTNPKIRQSLLGDSSGNH